VGWRSPGHAEHHRHGQSTDGDCVKDLPRVSEALGGRVGFGEQCRIVSAERGWPGRSCPANRSSRVAIKSAVVVETY
jgi:hypothetical protein